MLQNIEEQAIVPNGDSKNVIEFEGGRRGESVTSSSSSMPNSPNLNSRPTSMVIKKAHHIIPAHLVAEAISTLHGLDLRWSGPITPAEMQYVQQYVFAKYPEYCNGLVDEHTEKIDLYTLCINDDDDKITKSSGPSSDYSNQIIQLEPSKLLEIIAKKSSFHGNFMSIPEIQGRNGALANCGLSEEDYLVVFTANPREAMAMVGESYPFFRGNYYMSILGDDCDVIREFAARKETRVVAAPETWLDLRIRGSQLSQYFRRKCKSSFYKGLFAYAARTGGGEARASMHWISEAHRNSWHVLLDASGLMDGGDRLALALHRPDFVICTVDVARGAQPSRITCLLVRKNSFDAGVSE